MLYRVIIVHLLGSNLHSSTSSQDMIHSYTLLLQKKNHERRSLCCQSTKRTMPMGDWLLLMIKHTTVSWWFNHDEVLLNWDITIF